MTNTIAAIATGGAMAAIGIIRISGDRAITAAAEVFRPACGISLNDAADRRMYYGELFGSDGELIDLCMCMISRGPGSYTGEDTAELHCHGSPVVLTEALRALFALGVRQAQAGEFTKRAFLNGRMDLTQAEAVIDLIESETPAAAKNAANQVRGAISRKLETVYSALVDIMAHFHAVIDYPDEDIDDFETRHYLASLQGAEEILRGLLATYNRGRILRSGIPTVIIGRSNTGKSSLLNALLGYERAIVTDIPGTTRDTISERILIGGTVLRMLDTAGLRKTDDIPENLGIAKTLDAAAGSRLAILVLDGSQPLQDEDYNALCAIPEGVPKVAAVNKSDLPAALRDAELASLGVRFCRISALTGEGIEELVSAISETAGTSDAPMGEILTNARQAEAISRSLDSISRSIDAILLSITPDALLTDIEAALGAIGELTGQTMREDIISRIFERFCVGK